MKRLAVLIAAAASLALPAGASAGAVVVDVEDNFFDPTPVSTTFHPGLAVVWDWGAGTNAHNVRQDDKLFRSGGVTTSDDLAITPTVGTFHYYCEAHGSPNGGMDGIVKTTPSFTLAPAGNPFRVSWAPSSGDNLTPGDRFDIQYRVKNGKWRLWKKNTAAFSRVFGKKNQPVNVNPANEYHFRGRTKQSGTNRRSDLSPKLTVQP